jgi:hypothetical protein
LPWPEFPRPSRSLCFSVILLSLAYLADSSRHNLYRSPSDVASPAERSDMF